MKTTFACLVSTVGCEVGITDSKPPPIIEDGPSLSVTWPHFRRGGYALGTYKTEREREGGNFMLSFVESDIHTQESKCEGMLPRA